MKEKLPQSLDDSSIKEWREKARLNVLATLADLKTAPPKSLLESKEFQAGLRSWWRIGSSSDSASPTEP